MAGKAQKTEHSGAKHGCGAYWGHKVDAKQDSRKKRRRDAKKQIEGILNFDTGVRYPKDYDKDSDPYRKGII